MKKMMKYAFYVEELLCATKNVLSCLGEICKLDCGVHEMCVQSFLNCMAQLETLELNDSDRAHITKMRNAFLMGSKIDHIYDSTIFYATVNQWDPFGDGRKVIGSSC